MRALWPTVIAPLLEAARPAVVVELPGEGASLADLLEAAAAELGASVHRDPAEAGRPDLAIVHGEPGGPRVREELDRLEQVSGAAGAPYPLTLVHGVDGPAGDPETLAAIEDFLEGSREDLDLIHVPGLGGTAILVSPQRLQGPDAGRLGNLLESWRLSPEALTQLAAVDAERVRAEALAAELAEELESARAGREAQSSAEREALRSRIGELVEREAELTAALARREARLAALEEGAIAAGAAPAEAPPPSPAAPDPELLAVSPLPQPVDRRGILVDPREEAGAGGSLQVIVRVGGDPAALRRCLWSLLSRCDRPFSLMLVDGGGAGGGLREVVEAFTGAHPQVPVVAEIPVDDSPGWRLLVEEPVTFGHRTVANLLAAAERDGPPRTVAAETPTSGVPEWAGIDAADLLEEGGGVSPAAFAGEEALAAALRQRLRDPLAIAYVLPGLPPGGSGGSHSVVQEARALAAIGARSRVLVEEGSADRVRELYPEAPALFAFYRSAAELGAALAGFDVVVATEAPSARLVAEQTRERPGVLGAYYVQDYEPLFSPVAGPSADAALLSYRQAEGLLLFAKTHWIANAVGAAHDLPVAKVKPSLDRETFHSRGRGAASGRARVLAMIRPRTPRRRAAETLAALAALKARLGEEVECLGFGCTAADFEGLPPAAGVEHLGLLSRSAVAETLRRCDLFLDLSAYQAFGRTGLEAMACGAVPLLPRRGGVAEYAVDGRNALLVDTEDGEAVVEAAAGLLGDRERLERLRADGIETASSFSVLGAAISQYACFAAHLPDAARR